MKTVECIVIVCPVCGQQFTNATPGARCAGESPRHPFARLQHIFVKVEIPGLDWRELARLEHEAEYGLK